MDQSCDGKIEPELPGCLEAAKAQKYYVAKASANGEPLFNKPGSGNMLQIWEYKSL